MGGEKRKKGILIMGLEDVALEVAKAAGEAAAKEGTNKLANAIGGLFPFWGMKKKAVDVYVRNIEQSDLSPEAKMMAIANTKKTFRELKNQTAIIDVAYTALGEGQNVDADFMENTDSELINRLIDSGKFVSDEELQLLWGNVLAGEFEHPGTTPKNIVRILSEISKEHAAVFSTLCSLRVEILADTGSDIQYFGQEIMAFLPDGYLEEMNINLGTMRELAQLGLIDFVDTGHYSRPIPKKYYPYVHIVCDDHVITVINSGNNFPTGHVLLTKAGRCISHFAPARYNQQHMERIKNCLEKILVMKFSPTPGIRITRGPGGEDLSMGYSYERQWTTPPQTPE